MIETSRITKFLSLLILLLKSNDTANFNHDKYLHQYLPFFVMKQETTINQTLHSYCKEQVQFKSQPMFINLTQWPSGLIYARNPYDGVDIYADDQYESSFYRDCTFELRAAPGVQIRLVFYGMEKYDTLQMDQYDDDSVKVSSTSLCVRIRNNGQVLEQLCSISLDESRSKLNDYLSVSNVVYLDIIRPSLTTENYDEFENSKQFRIFYTSFTLRSNTGSCQVPNTFDCQDNYCVHPSARCNGIEECRSNYDELFCIRRQQSTNHSHTHTNSHHWILLFLYVMYIFPL